MRNALMLTEAFPPPISSPVRNGCSSLAENQGPSRPGLRYGIRVRSIEQPKTPVDNRAGDSESVRLRRLRKDAERPLSVNLAEGISLSHQLMQFTDAARRS
jgi:hypothetical protein